MSRGANETNLLKENIEDQLKRLLTQLEDVESMKEELDEDEYQSTRKETIEQLQEFEKSLKKMMAGNITLVDSVNAAQLAIQAAIRNTTSPEILQMFLKKENGSMRTRLAALEQDARLGRISREAYEAQAGEILALLDKLKEPLSPAERELLNKTHKNMAGFVAASTDVDHSVMEHATRDISQSRSK
eukprot:gene34899-42262_t